MYKSNKRPADPSFAFSDEWYKWKGVKPPTHEGHDVDDEQLRAITKELAANHKCNWLQHGTTISCDAGDFIHGKYIPVGKILQGTDPNGLPILADVVITRQ